MNTENIVWLASYPKSGNTWLRIFLSCLLHKNKETLDINNLSSFGSMSHGRIPFDYLTGLDSSDLTEAEIDVIVPKMHNYISSKSEDKIYIKTHVALFRNKENQWILPLESTFKTIYLIRNPLDVCVSYAHHNGHSNFEKLAEKMNDSETLIARSIEKFDSQLHQKLGCWSAHVKSWQFVPDDKILFVRYEDLNQNPFSFFSKIVQFLELDYNSNEIKTAIEKSSFKKLQKLEAKNGFIEKKRNAQSFFRKGKIGSWKEELSTNVIESIIETNKEVMLTFNYC